METDEKTEIEKLLNTPHKVVGMKQVLRGLSEGAIAQVIVAEDAEADVKNRIVQAAKAAGVQIEYTASQQRLGGLVKIERSAATVGILIHDV